MLKGFSEGIRKDLKLRLLYKSNILYLEATNLN